MEWSGRLAAGGEAIEADERLHNHISQLRAAGMFARLRQSDAPLPDFDFDPQELSRVAYLLRAEQARRTARERRSNPERIRLAAEMFEDLARQEPDLDRRLILSCQAATMWSLAGYQANAAVSSAPLRELGYNERSALVARMVASLISRQVRAAEENARQTRARFEDFDASVAESLSSESQGDESTDEVTQRHVNDLLADAAELASLGLLARATHNAVEFWQTGSSDAASAALEDSREAAKMVRDAGIVYSWLLLDSVSHVLNDSFAVSLWRRLPSYVSNWNRHWDVHLRLLASDEPAVVELWPSQLYALEAGLLDPNQSSLAIRMPTSAGKTRLAEFALLAATGNPGSETLAVYIVPTRALAAEVEKRLASQFTRLGVRVSALFGGFDHSDYEATLLDNTDVLVATAEKLDLLIRQDEQLAQRISLVLVDEAQILGAHQRGMGVELLLSRLRRWLPTTRILTMSAVLPNVEDLGSWLGYGTSRSNSVENHWAPSRVHRGVFVWRGRQVTIGQAGTVEYEGEDFYLGSLLKREPNSTRSNARPYPREKKETAAELTLHFGRLGPVLVGCATKPQTDWVARGIHAALEKRGATGVPPDDSDRLRDARQSLATTLERWLPADHPQLMHVRCGFALHRADLPDDVLRAVEHGYRTGALHALIATSTLSEGVNLPAQTVIVPYTQRNANESLTIAEVQNLAGRAGRAFTETEAHVVLVADTQRQANALKERYFRRDSEAVRSTLVRLYVELIRLRIPSLKRSLEVSEALELDDPSPGDASFPHDLLEQLDSQLLALAAEETVDTPDEDVVRELLDGTLWSVQTASLKLAQTPFVRFAARRWGKLKEAIPEAERRGRFFRTGLSVGTCQELDAALEALVRSSRQLFDTERHQELVAELLTIVSSTNEMARSCYQAGIESRVMPGLASGWLNGATVSDLFDAYSVSAGADDVVQMATVVESVLARDLPWLVSASIELLRGHLGELWEPERRLSALPAMLKFGVGSVGASYAASIGIRDRGAANNIGEAFEATGGAYLNEFIRWLAALPASELASLLPEGDTRHVLSRVAVLAANRQARTLAAAGQGTVDTALRGLGYEGRMARVESLALPVPVMLEREADNPFDPNAILVRSTEGDNLGYVARETASAVAPILDEGAHVQALLVSYAPGSHEANLEISVEG